MLLGIAHVGSLISLICGYIAIWLTWQRERVAPAILINLGLAATVFGASFWLPTTLAMRTQLSFITYLWLVQATFKFLRRPRIKKPG